MDEKKQGASPLCKPLQKDFSDFEQMMRNGLLCRSCWNRVLRTVEEPKYLNRLLRAWHGEYTGNVDGAVKRLTLRLDNLRKLDKEKARQQERKRCIGLLKDLNNHEGAMAIMTDDELAEELKKQGDEEC